MRGAASSLLLFNPSRASSDELESTFVGRKRVLKDLEDAIRHDATGPSPRHWQIVGPRGSGKSHLTEILVRRLAADGWLVARLPEEHYSVGSLAELLEEIVVRLLGVRVSPFAGEKDPRRVEELAIDLLQSKRRESGRRAVAVIENLGLLLENQLGGHRDQARLRQILTKDPPVIVIATETSYIEATTSHDAPFYDFFQTLTLSDLERDEVIALIQARVRWDKDERLLGEFAAVRRRVEAIYHLSGGNPRLVLALCSILRDGVTVELVSQLIKLLDDVTPYYQARLRDVSPQAARVMAAMALAERVETPSELGRRLRLPTAQVSSIITRLTRDRYVQPGGRPDAKRRYYELSDRLFRIWLQMREGDSAGRERLRFVAEFFQRWYEGAAEELDAEVSSPGDSFGRELTTGYDERSVELPQGELWASDVGLLGVLDKSRRERPRARRSMIARALDGLQLESTSRVIVAEAACELTHDQRFLELSEKLWRDLAASVPPRTFLRHWLELMVRREATGDSDQATAMLDEMARLTDATKIIVTLMFAEAMPALGRRVAMRKAVLDVYRRLVAKDAIQNDLFPYALAVQVADSANPERELASLHPEHREAVSLILGKVKRSA